MKTVLSVILCLQLVTGMSVVAQSKDEAVQEPVLSYYVCDWGLLTVEQQVEQPPIFIEVSSPVSFSAVEGTQFTVSGIGAGLFEGNVVVEATANGEVIFSEPTVLHAEEIGAVGEWSIEVDLGELEGATPVLIRAYSPSPEDGSTMAADSIDINVNSEFGLRYVEIFRPSFRAGVSASPLLVEGTAGAAFENNIVIKVRDVETDAVLTETFATVQTEALAGSGPFSAELMVNVEPGTAISIFAYHPAVADDDEVSVFARETAVVNPLAQTYDRFLTVRANDPILSSEQVCAAAAAEFDNTNINPLVINDVQVMSTMSMFPLVNVSIEAAGSSVCPSPLRTRIFRDGDTFNIEIYHDTTEPAVCTADLAPIMQRVSLGTLPNPDYTITVNGETVVGR